MPSIYGTLKFSVDGECTATFEQISKAFVFRNTGSDEELFNTSIEGSSERHAGRGFSSKSDEGISKVGADSVFPRNEPITVYGRLTYNDISELTSKHSFNGAIGDINYIIALDNGPVIEGLANQPGLAVLISVAGFTLIRNGISIAVNPRGGCTTSRNVKEERERRLFVPYNCQTCG